MEHHSNIVPWQIVAGITGATVRFAPITSSGELDMDAFRGLLSERTRIVGVVHVSNVLGTLNPVAEITRLAHEQGALVVVDGSQSVPHMPVDVPAIGCDFYAFTGHKMLGPTGIGVLVGRTELLESMEPFLGGGEMISNVSTSGSTWADLPWKFEAGTPPIAEAIGLGAAADYLMAVGLDAVRAHEVDLTGYMLDAPRHGRGHHDLRPARPGGARRGRLVQPPRHPPARHRAAGRPQRRVRAGRPPLRQAADARAGRGRHGPREHLSLQFP